MTTYICGACRKGYDGKNPQCPHEEKRMTDTMEISIRTLRGMLSGSDAKALGLAIIAELQAQLAEARNFNAEWNNELKRLGFGERFVEEYTAQKMELRATTERLAEVTRERDEAREFRVKWDQELQRLEFGQRFVEEYSAQKMQIRDLTAEIASLKAGLENASRDA